MNISQFEDLKIW